MTEQKRVDDYGRVFSALGNSLRLRILEFIRGSGLKECIVGLIATGVNVRPSVASHHLKLLLEAGLVTFRESGRYSCYGINKDRLIEIQKYLGVLL